MCFTLTFITFLFSVFYPTNETLNIWTHFIPLLFMTYHYWKFITVDLQIHHSFLFYPYWFFVAGKFYWSPYSLYGWVMSSKCFNVLLNWKFNIDKHTPRQILISLSYKLVFVSSSCKSRCWLKFVFAIYNLDIMTCGCLEIMSFTINILQLIFTPRLYKIWWWLCFMRQYRSSIVFLYTSVNSLWGFDL